MIGNTAIIETNYKIHKNYPLDIVLSYIHPEIVIIDAFNNTDKFNQLPSLNIDTIIIESFLSEENKVISSFLDFIDVINSSGWRPKRIINTLDYGNEKLFVLCHKLNIDVYQLSLNNGEDRSQFKFLLEKNEFLGLKLDVLKMTYSHYNQLKR
jgi:hypothetical protein